LNAPFPFRPALRRLLKTAIFSTLFICAVAPGYPQLVSFGVKAGVPLNDALHGSSNGAAFPLSLDTGRWLVGPTVELHLPFRLSFEVDGLYRRDKFQLQTSQSAPPGEWFSRVPVSVINHYSLNDWQFPFLAKYEIRSGALRPFVDAGVTYRHLSGEPYIEDRNQAGFTVGGGVTLKLSFLRLSPEIRYTRWSSREVDDFYVSTTQNQTDLMVGFTF